jgi:hypothetical protein
LALQLVEEALVLVGVEVLSTSKSLSKIEDFV